jgi:SAM-dependent MidA family methyltransferase
MANGFDVASYQSQADFLIAGGILEHLQVGNISTFDEMQQKAQLKRLTLPSEMGEDFKALSLTKNLDQLLPRLQLADRRYSL